MGTGTHTVMEVKGECWSLTPIEAVTDMHVLGAPITLMYGHLQHDRVTVTKEVCYSMDYRPLRPDEEVPEVPYGSISTGILIPMEVFFSSDYVPDDFSSFV